AGRRRGALGGGLHVIGGVRGGGAVRAGGVVRVGGAVRVGGRVRVRGGRGIGGGGGLGARRRRVVGGAVVARVAAALGRCLGLGGRLAVLLAGQHGLGGRQHHGHVAAVLKGGLLDDGDLRELAGQLVQQRGPALGVGDLATAEHDRHLDAVPAEQKALDVALLGVVVVLGDLRQELD